MTPTTTPMATWLESAWLARYLDRQLSGEEAAWFEAYLLDKPELLGMVEVDNELRDGLAVDVATWRSANDSVHQIGATQEAREENNTSPHDSRSESINLPTEPAPRSGDLRSPPRWLALAASLVAGLSVGWLGQHALTRSPQAELLIADPTRIVYDTVRGAAVAPVIERANSSAPYVLLDAAVPDGAEHVSLVVGDGKPVILQVSNEGFVTALVSRDLAARARNATLMYRLDGAAIEQVLPLNLDERSP